MAGLSSVVLWHFEAVLSEFLTFFPSPSSLLIAYYVAFGPHGPRAPTSAPGDNLKIFLATVALVGVGGILYLATHHFGTSFKRKTCLVYLSNLFFLSFHVRCSCPTSKDVNQGMAGSN